MTSCHRDIVPPSQLLCNYEVPIYIEVRGHWPVACQFGAVSDVGQNPEEGGVSVRRDFCCVNHEMVLEFDVTNRYLLGAKDPALLDAWVIPHSLGVGPDHTGSGSNAFLRRGANLVVRARRGQLTPTETQSSTLQAGFRVASTRVDFVDVGTSAGTIDAA